ncbi:YALIA101S09e02322g1_1 [Yarrowia lipolytica]|nr:YALIA101S09e02322g1_1 [Yarrowia lipolytica]VBB87536.1 Hypothetical protein YALIH222_S04E03510G [Yarrowia lipolytica]
MAILQCGLHESIVQHLTGSVLGLLQQDSVRPVRPVGAQLEPSWSPVEFQLQVLQLRNDTTHNHCTNVTGTVTDGHRETQPDTDTDAAVNTPTLVSQSYSCDLNTVTRESYTLTRTSSDLRDGLECGMEGWGLEDALYDKLKYFWLWYHKFITVAPQITPQTTPQTTLTSAIGCQW